MSGDKLLYWDSCIFISWLKNENRPDPNDMAGVRDIIERLKKRDVKEQINSITLQMKMIKDLEKYADL